MKRTNPKINALLLAYLVMLATPSCTVNEQGEFEFTWLFWLILVVFMLMFINTAINNAKEAKEKGISLSELAEQKKKETEQREMREGFEVEYLGGYPKWPNPCKVIFSINDSKISLKKGGETCLIPKEDIVAISNEKSGKRSLGKTAAGALVGGVLTGGIGLIVGGALGARRSDTSEVYVTYKYNGAELTLNLKPGKNTDKVYAWINSVFA